MTPGAPDDVRLDARQVATRLGVTPRHLARISGFPAPHYLLGLKRWWASEIAAWEALATSATPPASIRRGAANLRRGPTGPGSRSAS